MRIRRSEACAIRNQFYGVRKHSLSLVTFSKYLKTDNVTNCSAAYSKKRLPLEDGK